MIYILSKFLYLYITEQKQHENFFTAILLKCSERIKQFPVQFATHFQVKLSLSRKFMSRKSSGLCVQPKENYIQFKRNVFFYWNLL